MRKFFTYVFLSFVIIGNCVSMNGSEQGFNKKCRFGDQNYGLFDAIDYGSVAAVREALNNGANVKHVIEYMIDENGTRIEDNHFCGMNALHLALYNNHTTQGIITAICQSSPGCWNLRVGESTWQEREDQDLSPYTFDGWTTFALAARSNTDIKSLEELSYFCKPNSKEMVCIKNEITAREYTTHYGWISLIDIIQYHGSDGIIELIEEDSVHGETRSHASHADMMPEDSSTDSTEELCEVTTEAFTKNKPQKRVRFDISAELGSTDVYDDIDYHANRILELNREGRQGSLDISILQNELTEAEKMLKAEKIRREIAEEEQTNYTAAIDQLEHELDGLRQEHKDCDVIESNFRRMIEELQKNNAYIEDELNQALDRTYVLQEDHEKTQNLLNIKIQELKQELAEQEALRAQALEDAQNQWAYESRETDKKWLAIVAELQALIEAKMALIEELEEFRENYDVDMISLKEELENIEYENEQLKKELDALKDKRAALQTDLDDSNRDRSDLQDKINYINYADESTDDENWHVWIDGADVRVRSDFNDGKKIVQCEHGQPKIASRELVDGSLVHKRIRQ